MHRFSLFSSLLFMLCLHINTYAQSNDSIPVMSDLDTEEVTITSPLLPQQFFITQKIFWGEKGVMRHLAYFNLSEENRERELNIRSTMITAHQYIGYATLAGMVAQGIVGAQLYKGENVKDLHEGIAGAVNIGYFTTAGLAFLAPPRRTERAKGFNALTLHKVLGAVHLSGMILSNVLADQAGDNQQAKALHRAASFTAFGAFAASMIVIQF